MPWSRARNEIVQFVYLCCARRRHCGYFSLDVQRRSKRLFSIGQRPSFLAFCILIRSRMFRKVDAHKVDVQRPSTSKAQLAMMRGRVFVHSRPKKKNLKGPSAPLLLFQHSKWKLIFLPTTNERPTARWGQKRSPTHNHPKWKIQLDHKCRFSFRSRC